MAIDTIIFCHSDMSLDDLYTDMIDDLYTNICTTHIRTKELTKVGWMNRGCG